MAQQGQVFVMKSNGPSGSPLWGYRYRTGGRGSGRVQRGGFVSEQDACESLERLLERMRRANGIGSTLTLTGLVDEYLAQHDAQPETIEKLRWLLSKAVSEFGNQRLGQLRSQEIAAWRMTIPAGHRFEATQALRQVLSRAVDWQMIDINPAKHGVHNPQHVRQCLLDDAATEEVIGSGARASVQSRDATRRGFGRSSSDKAARRCHLRPRERVPRDHRMGEPGSARRLMWVGGRGGILTL